MIGFLSGYRGIDLLTRTWRAVFSHRIPLHAHCQALLKATELARIARHFVDDTILVFSALVRQVFLHGALEEALAALATVQTVMVTAALVTANHTRPQRLQISIVAIRVDRYRTRVYFN
jgi:hypothetical protein